MIPEPEEIKQAYAEACARTKAKAARRAEMLELAGRLAPAYLAYNEGQLWSKVAENVVAGAAALLSEIDKEMKKR